MSRVPGTAWASRKCPWQKGCDGVGGSHRARLPQEHGPLQGSNQKSSARRVCPPRLMSAARGRSGALAPRWPAVGVLSSVSCRSRAWGRSGRRGVGRSERGRGGEPPAALHPTSLLCLLSFQVPHTPPRSPSGTWQSLGPPDGHASGEKGPGCAVVPSCGEVVVRRRAAEPLRAAEAGGPGSCAQLRTTG